MSGLTDNNVKLAMGGAIYVSVALIVAAGFSIRGMAVQAADKSLSEPVSHVSESVAVRQAEEQEGDRQGKKTDTPVAGDFGGAFEPGDLVEPALDLVTRRVLRRFVL